VGTFKKILITGSNGLLGRSLEKRLKNKFILFGLGRRKRKSINYVNCDLRDKKRLNRLFFQLRPDIVIHTAAISDVEYCEKNPQEAYEINALGTYNVCQACKKINAFLIYISTDYVFNGKRKKPYKETDKTIPINIYGKTKLEGERFIQTSLDRYLIIRTSWLFGPGRDNFVTQILKRVEKEKEMGIISDKFASPTYTVDLSSAICDLILLFTVNCNLFTVNRIIHISNSGFCSRYEFTKKILGYAEIKRIKIKPISSKDFGWQALRPRYSVLDNSRFQKLMGYTLRPWYEALREYIRKGWVWLRN